MKTLAAVAALFAFLAGVAMAGGGDPLGIAKAVEAWSAAKVQVAQIDADVEIYRITVDAVQRANDRGMVYMLLGAALVLGALALPKIMRHWESEGAHYERMAKAQDAARGYHLHNLPSDAAPLNDTTLAVRSHPTRHARINRTT